MSALLKMRSYQVKAIREIHTKWDAGVTRPAVVLPTGAGKGHPLWTMVPTPQGMRRWGDLKQGDQVYGSNGRPTEVTAIYDRGELPTWRVAFTDGSSVIVDGEHLWRVWDYSHRRTSKEWRTLSTEQLIAEGIKLKRGHRFRVPMVRPVGTTIDQDLPLHPYVVGALLANGGMTHTGTMLTTPDSHVSGRVSCWVTVNRIADTTPGVCPRFSLPGLTGITERLGMRVKSGEKRIPPTYLLASIRQRIDLLHGLMDGDGSMRDDARRSVLYSTTSPQLADDVRQLVASLGGTANVSISRREGRAPEYSIGIMLPGNIPAFSTPAKRGSGDAAQRSRVPVRSIVSIEPARPEFIRCITVAAANSLYLITRDHIVTHNTVVFAHLAEQFLAANPGRRVLVLAHTDELVNQAARKMRDVAPGRTVGIVKAQQDETHAEVVVASVQSLRSKSRRDRIRNVGLVVCDEAHHAVAKTYKTVFEHFGVFDSICAECREASDQVSSDEGKRVWPSYCPIEDCLTNRTKSGPVYAAGFTATLVRADKEKLSDVWEDVAFRLSIAFMIRSGYLLNVRGKRVEVPTLDLGQVKTSGGDYQEGALGDALIEAFAPEIVAKAYAEHAADRKGLVFAPTVDSAHVFADAFNEQGIKTEVVYGALPRDERRGILERLKTGATQVVANCMVLTEGFDEPTVSCAVIARPTKSAGLYQQMVGRVLRPDLSLPPDQRGEALILDVVGISRQHDLRSLVDLSTREDLPEDVDEDLSLLQLEDLIVEEEEEETGAGGREQETYYVGPAETREFDPLGRDSARTWGQTPDGHYYLPYAGQIKPGTTERGGGGYIFLADSLKGDPGTYDVIWCTKAARGPVAAAGMTEHRGQSFEMAIAWGEEEVNERGGFGTKTLTDKKARWRKDPASSAQAGMVRRAGHRVDQVGDEFYLIFEGQLPPMEKLTKGKASELIDAHAAAGRIDPLVALVKAQTARSGR